MPSRVTPFFAFLLLGFASVGCRYTGAMSETLHTDASTSVSGVVGEEMTFDLPGNAGTGYAWSLNGALPEFLEAVGEATFVADHAGMPGSSGVTRFQFMAVATGSATLRFEYARAWEKDVPPVRWAEVEMSIK